jgi:hypothetical protein
VCGLKTQADFYHIRVRGHLDQRWADWFDGFEIQGVGEDTVLTGCVLDQAALHGVLAKIRDLGLTILMVERLVNRIGNNHEEA